MQIAPLPANEESRLSAVEALGLLGTPPEQQYDDLALIASRICRARIALISLIGKDQQWLKAHVGTEVQTTPRDVSICSHTILQDRPLVVGDLAKDPRFADNPLVAQGPKLRFYAGVPLIDDRGHALGTICVLDDQPRTEPLTEDQSEALVALSRQVVALTKLGRAAAEQTRLFEIAQEAAAQREHEATHDTLTGLPNRSLFTERVIDAVSRARRATDKTTVRGALLFIDLDGFKLINDSLGHAAGDALLKIVAERLTTGVRGERKVNERAGGRAIGPEMADVVSRIGGDEFTVLLRNLREAADAELVADRLITELARPLELAGQPVGISGSVGIAHIDGRHESADDVMREADTAMYHAKLAGKGRHVTFDAAMREAALDRLKLDNDLRHALTYEPDQLCLFYQPVVSLVTGETIGFESLIRWRHPTRGLIPPSAFIPLAEESKLIVQLGNWIIDEACRQLAEWSARDPRLAAMSLNINVSRRQLVDPTLIPHLRAAVDRTGLDPRRIKLEITESSIMQDPTTAADAMRSLRELGVELYMDDFGTGYSSLSCLHRFPLDGLKVDRSFIMTMTERRDYAAIVHAVMNLARNFKMRVTAEGIETFEQVQLLQMLECDLGQGYYFAKPLPPELAAQYVLSAKPPMPMAA